MASTHDEIAKHLLLGHSCDNCKHMSVYDPVCTYLNNYYDLAEDGVCECWEPFEGNQRFQYTYTDVYR